MDLKQHQEVMSQVPPENQEVTDNDALRLAHNLEQNPQAPTTSSFNWMNLIARSIIEPNSEE
jgi:hypothetical protein